MLLISVLAVITCVDQGMLGYYSYASGLEHELINCLRVYSSNIVDCMPLKVPYKVDVYSEADVTTGNRGI